MRSNDSRGSGRRSGRGPRRSSRPRNETTTSRPATQTPPAKKTFWQKLVSFFSSKPAKSAPASTNGNANGSAQNRGSASAPPREARPVRKPEAVEVTSPKLYVGNLSYDATESDLSELFNGVGTVKSAEIVSHKYNEKSKGFGFVTMTTVDEAKRAVVELHDKEFMGRKLVVSGAKTSEREPNYRG
ncbi:RNP-1 like RNA-binding protein [Chthoniobacter flavus Ellin428]|uniref:RNP-1 like RNA-binding protein n=1 Tax=Chthoniobacter flavus Ellin428 TaxID=497964 RepID=B4D0A1_9BACT|nr:RNA-binding protein [Chthoniobacter flavus]EDY20415.1 RNP-1 like RNA-binding protein [Chthoniobacter flavus Ellin428]TCO94303.1 RNA recognition motif-containing protein [Chthoniobacter flavus]